MRATWPGRQEELGIQAKLRTRREDTELMFPQARDVWYAKVDYNLSGRGEDG
jgi:hypothetical protein